MKVGREAEVLMVIKNMTKKVFSKREICSILEIRQAQFAELQAKVRVTLCPELLQKLRK